MICTLASSLVPSKYILKRLKLLSSYISLTPYFNCMIEHFTSTKVLIEIHKYYYNIPHTMITLMYLVNNMLDNTFEEQLIPLLKTIEEKNMLYIYLSVLKNVEPKHHITDKTIIDIISNNNIMKVIQWNELINTIDYNSFNKRFLQILISCNYITNYLYNNTISYYNINELILYTRFYSPEKYDKRIIGVNYVLHKLRLMAKLKKKTKIINHNVKMFNVLNEIKTFEPTQNIKVLSSGSQYFQLNKMKFTILPPRHLLPKEISIYKNFLLREKADGILIYNLPINIYPQHDMLSLYQVKAEYIEDLDLYLVFDIDIPNTTIIERYNILRTMHRYTQNTNYDMITTFSDFTKILETEQKNICKFLKENINFQLKWYPKFACNVNSSINIYKELIDNVILEKYTFPSNLYNCDGAKY
jgi:hypothetical protein